MLLYMKNTCLFLVAAVLVLPALSQSLTTTYFGQEPPGDTPRLFAPGFISREGRYELMAAYAPDGKEFCFTVTNEHWSHFEIWHTLFDGQKWSEPAILPFSANMQCFGPAFAADNSRLFFSSANWVTHPATIWYSNRLPGGWSSPVKADSLINAGADQWQCTVAGDGTLVFDSKRQGGKGEYDLYMVEPGGGPGNLSALNSPADEYSAFIAPDKSYIIFSSQRTGGYGWDDLYIAFQKKDGGWTQPVNLGPEINTVHAEFSPQVTPDGHFLIYSKWDAKNKWSDIYWVRIDGIIKRLRKEGLL
jgi:hypothetical protein